MKAYQILKAGHRLEQATIAGVLVSTDVRTAEAVVGEAVLVPHHADEALESAGDPDLFVGLELREADHGVRLEHVAVQLSKTGGRPVLTLQNPHARVQVSPRIMIVATPRAQHSPMFGHRASSQTVWRWC